MAKHDRTALVNQAAALSAKVNGDGHLATGASMDELLAEITKLKGQLATAKKTCVLSLEEFTKDARPITVVIDGKELSSTVKAPFSSGSFGWNVSGKVPVTVGDRTIMCQVGVNVIAIGSKPLAAE
jgi:hypothetical protein